MSEIKRTATANGGTPLGIGRFFSETGIKSSDWMGKHWARWGDALVEAGFRPNQFNAPRPEDDLLSKLAAFVRELGRFPVRNEIVLKARRDPGFPWHNTLRRLGGKRATAERLQQFCRDRGEDDVVAICAAVLESRGEIQSDSNVTSAQADAVLGYVYLMKAGKFFKVGLRTPSAAANASSPFNYPRR